MANHTLKLSGPAGVRRYSGYRTPAAVRAVEPTAAIIRHDGVVGTDWIVFGTVYDALPVHAKL